MLVLQVMWHVTIEPLFVLLLLMLCVYMLCGVVTLSAPELLFILKEEAFRCTQLGVHLKVPYGTLKTMGQQSLTSRPIKDCFMEMCQHWLTNATDKTWAAVYTALVQQDNKRLMTHLRDTRKYSPTSTGDNIYVLLCGIMCIVGMCS